MSWRCRIHLLSGHGINHVSAEIFVYILNVHMANCYCNRWGNSHETCDMSSDLPADYSSLCLRSEMFLNTCFIAFLRGWGPESRTNQIFWAHICFFNLRSDGASLFRSAQIMILDAPKPAHQHTLEYTHWNTNLLLGPLGARGLQTLWCLGRRSQWRARGLIDLWKAHSVCSVTPPWLTYLRK